jgi:hypothetical protein
LAGELALDCGEIVTEEIEDLSRGRNGDGTHAALRVAGSLFFERLTEEDLE